MSAYDSNVAFKDILTESEGTTVKYGSNQWREIMRMFNAQTIATRLIKWTNPWRWENFFEVKAIAAPGNATSGNVRVFVDTSDGKLKVKKSDGQVFSLEEQPGTSATHRTQHSVIGQDAFIKTDILGGSTRYLETLLGDPASDPGRLWIEANDLQFWDNQTTPVLQTAEKTSNKNANSGYAGLSATGKIDIAQLPSIVDSTISTHISTKISITNKAQLNSQIAYLDATGWVTSAMISSSRIADKNKLHASLGYRDQNNNWGAFYQDYARIGVPSSPASGSRRMFVDNADDHLKVKTSSGGVVDLEAAATPTVNLMPDGSGPPTSGKWGAYWGGATEGTGIMAGMWFYGDWEWLPSTVNSWTRFTSEALDESQAGFTTKLGVSRRDRNPYLKYKFKSVISTERLWTGFYQGDFIPPNQNRPGDLLDVILFGYGTSDSTWKVLVNNSASSVTTYDTGLTKDTIEKTVEMILDESATRLIVKVDGIEELNITSGVPGNATNGWNLAAITESVGGSAAPLDVNYMYLKNSV